MSERGVFAVDRGVWDHSMFAPEPFTEREAWLWMISTAAWAARRVRVGRAQIELQRGQLAFATRFLAEKWKWAHSKVVRFLKRLETDTMVSTFATREATLITICNYDKYAFGRNASETQPETPTDTASEHPRNKEEETNKLIKEKDAAIAAPDAESDLFRRGKEILGKTAGGLIKQLLTAKGGKVNLARAAIETSAGKENPREYIGGIIRNRDPPPGEVSRFVDGRL